MKDQQEKDYKEAVQADFDVIIMQYQPGEVIDPREDYISQSGGEKLTKPGKIKHCNHSRRYNYRGSLQSGTEVWFIARGDDAESVYVRTREC